ncbi:hypothetical protein [Streptomyces flavidovirens]|uniref:Uncharacterized protein n=1 Tax=Streptomyces flavidovirens TaxID=67298 RepID=A0ABW6RQR2_9ACTN
MTTVGGDETDELMEFVGDITDYWSYTQVRDWVLLKPGMTRTALHLYLLLRAMVSETARRTGGGLRRMSLDQLCYLLPGINDKPASPTMVKDALRLLDEHNLVVNPNGGRLVTSTGKGGIQNTFRKYQVNDLPPDSYTGWRNVWDKLDSYTPDWRENPPQPPVHTRTENGVQQSASRISDHRSDQGRSDDGAGRFDGRKSDPPGRKSDQAGRKSDPTGRKKDASKPLTSENSPPKETPQKSSSLSAASETPPAPLTRAEPKIEREINASRDMTPAPSDASVPHPRPEAKKTSHQPQLPLDLQPVMEAYITALGVYPTQRIAEQLRRDALELLELRWPVEHVAKLAGQLPGLGYSSLAKHAGHNPPPASKAASRGASLPWCTKCESPDYRWIAPEDGPAKRCPACNPAVAVAAP